MADRNPQVMEMVVAALDQDPGAELEALYQQARDIDPQIGELSLRQFHARYPLQAKRIKSRGSRGKRGGGRGRRKAAERAPREAAPRRAKAPAAGESRDRVRAIFLEFAGDFARAETKPDIVKVLGDVDAYVDRVFKAVSG